MVTLLLGLSAKVSLGLGGIGIMDELDKDFICGHIADARRAEGLRSAINHIGHSITWLMYEVADLSERLESIEEKADG